MPSSRDVDSTISRGISLMPPSKTRNRTTMPLMMRPDQSAVLETGLSSIVFMNRPVEIQCRYSPSAEAGGELLARRSGFDDHLEAAVDHALGVERHRLAGHHVGEARVLHD